MSASDANSNPAASALPLTNTYMNRMVSKQLLQADAVGLFRLIRLAGVNEVLTVARTPVVWNCASMLFTRGECEYSGPIKV